MTLPIRSEFDEIFRGTSSDALFTTEARWTAMLRFEQALALAQAQCGIIPPSAAAVISRACSLDQLDLQAVSRGAKQSGNVAIPLVKQLTAAVARIDRQAADFVHLGATSQDVIDTALVLRLKQHIALLETQLHTLCHTLAEHAKRHKATVMPGRTLLQQAVPISFGLKAATWLDAMLRHCDRLRELTPRLLVLQFGGAAGTLAALGENGWQVAEALAAELELSLPALPWHTERDRLAEFCAFHGLLVGTLGKIARDLSLCMQTELNELSEPSAEGRGSSTMPHKRNPVASAVVLAAAVRVPGLVATALTAMVQEHERALGGWHAEWEVVPEIAMLTAGALTALSSALEGLEVNPSVMQSNLDLSGGMLLAEAVSMALASSIGRVDSQKLVTAASREALEERLPLRDVLKRSQTVMQHLTPQDLDRLFQPTNYLGDTNGMIDRVLDLYARRDIPHDERASQTV